MKPIRVLLADNQRLVRAGIRSLLEEMPDIQVVAEASDRYEVMRMVEEHLPDVVLLELTMPAASDFELTRQIINSFPTIRLVIFSVYSDKERVYLAMRAGAAGYVLKAAKKVDLEAAIRTVAAGATYLSPSISQTMQCRQHDNTLKKLSSRQIQVLQLIAQGKSTKQIALELEISIKTAETHRMQLMNRLEIRDVAALVRFAIRVGLVRIER